jgi:hypothetical protein
MLYFASFFVVFAISRGCGRWGCCCCKHSHTTVTIITFEQQNKFSSIEPAALFALAALRTTRIASSKT